MFILYFAPVILWLAFPYLSFASFPQFFFVTTRQWECLFSVTWKRAKCAVGENCPHQTVVWISWMNEWITVVLSGPNRYASFFLYWIWTIGKKTQVCCRYVIIQYCAAEVVNQTLSSWNVNKIWLYFSLFSQNIDSCTSLMTSCNLNQIFTFGFIAPTDHWFSDVYLSLFSPFPLLIKLFPKRLKQTVDGSTQGSDASLSSCVWYFFLVFISCWHHFQMLFICCRPAIFSFVLHMLSLSTMPI